MIPDRIVRALNRKCEGALWKHRPLVARAIYYLCVAFILMVMVSTVALLNNLYVVFNNYL